MIYLNVKFFAFPIFDIKIRIFWQNALFYKNFILTSNSGVPFKKIGLTLKIKINVKFEVTIGCPPVYPTTFIWNNFHKIPCFWDIRTPTLYNNQIHTSHHFEFKKEEIRLPDLDHVNLRKWEILVGPYCSYAYIFFT